MLKQNNPSDDCSLDGINPFTDEFVREQVELYDLRSYDKDGVKIEMQAAVGAIPDYLNKQFLVGDLPVPVFTIDGRVWMCLSRMEVQSQFVPTYLAEGRVAVLGLGMGYYCLLIMHLDRVTEVVVYESDQRVIDFFTEKFSDRNGFDKVKFVLGDVRETFVGETFDVCYADVYATLLCEDIVGDSDRFQDLNRIGTYVYWGFELALMFALDRGLVEVKSMPAILRWFYKTWARTPSPGTGNTTFFLAELPYGSGPYDEEVLDLVTSIKLPGLYVTEAM